MLTAGGATQLGTSGDDYAPCADSGQNCTDDIYAVSLPGVTPSAFITWFQAQQACTNAGKRLPTNAEWQAAVAGTPDPGPDDGTTDCNTASAFAVTRDRVAQRLRLGARRLRHGRQPLGVGGRLGAALDDVRDVERRRQPDGRRPVPGRRGRRRVSPGRCCAAATSASSTSVRTPARSRSSASSSRRPRSFSVVFGFRCARVVHGGLITAGG